MIPLIYNYPFLLLFYHAALVSTSFHRLMVTLLILRFALLGPTTALLDFEADLPFVFFPLPPFFFFSFWVRLSNHRLSCSKVKLHSFANFLIYSCRAFMVPFPLGNTFSVNMRSNLSQIFLGIGTRLRRVTIAVFPLAIFNM